LNPIDAINILNDLIENAMENIQDTLEFLNRLSLKTDKFPIVFQLFAKSAITAMGIISTKYDNLETLNQSNLLSKGFQSRVGRLRLNFRLLKVDP
jgi:hypothetical protein